MTRFKKLICLLCILFAVMMTETVSARKPNIVIFLADDLGYGELGCQGNRQIPTPHIDSIANAGVRFTDGYVTAPYCSPSRAGMMTGRFQQRFGYTINVMPHVPGGSEHGLPRNEITLGEQLKQAGYQTGIVGKWHLGAREDFNPIHNGFDYFFGFAHEGHFFVPPPYHGVTTMLRKRPLPGGRKGRWVSEEGIIFHDLLGNEPLYDLHNPILRGTEVVQEERYLTDAFTEEAVQFIDRNRDKPFFLYLPYNAVHSPLQGADRYMAKFSHIEDIQRLIFAAMLANMDDSVGTVLGKIREHQLEQETIIFFLSDNGGPTKELTSSNLPLSGGKGSLREGGIRIPFMVQWEGTIPAGGTFSKPVISLDIFATSSCVAGCESFTRPIDGVNLLPFLQGTDSTAPHEQLFWSRQRNAALRQGDWKVLKTVPRGKSTPTWQLFNLANDVSEASDLSDSHPDRLAKMKAALAGFQEKLAVSNKR